YDVENDAVHEIEVGAQPTRIARAGDRLFVTLRGEEKIAVLRIAPDRTISLETKIELGREPFGVAAIAAHHRIYATASASDLVFEIDSDSLEILRSWTVPDQP